MKAHVEPKSKECPFCGASTYEVMSGTGVKCIRCTNKRTCGAIVSFSNKDCNERGVSPVKYFNRRAEREQKNESDSWSYFRPDGDGAGVYCPDRGRIAHGGLVLGCESHGGPEGQKCKGGHMKAHLAFLCNGRCQWCKNYWDCSKTKRLLAKILGCKDWRWQNR